MTETLTQSPKTEPAESAEPIAPLPAAPDIDQLLNDAESLAQEIAEAVSVETDSPPAQEVVHAEPEILEPAPVLDQATEPPAATEQVATEPVQAGQPDVVQPELVALVSIIEPAPVALHLEQPP